MHTGVCLFLLAIGAARFFLLAGDAIHSDSCWPQQILLHQQSLPQAVSLEGPKFLGHPLSSPFVAVHRTCSAGEYLPYQLPSFCLTIPVLALACMLPPLWLAFSNCCSPILPHFLCVPLPSLLVSPCWQTFFVS